VPPPHAPQRRFVPRLLRLDDRIVPADLTVATTADHGPGSLFDAITQANATPGPNTITITATGTITCGYYSQLYGGFGYGLGAPLPPITTDLSIVGPGAGALTLTGIVFTTLYNAYDQTGGIDIKPGAKVSISGVALSNTQIVAEAGAVTTLSNLSMSGSVLNLASGMLFIGATYRPSYVCRRRAKVRRCVGRAAAEQP
jgi:hypothetical protein